MQLHINPEDIKDEFLSGENIEQKDITEEDNKEKLQIVPGKFIEDIKQEYTSEKFLIPFGEYTEQEDIKQENIKKEFSISFGE